MMMKEKEEQIGSRKESENATRQQPIRMRYETFLQPTFMSINIYFSHFGFSVDLYTIYIKRNGYEKLLENDAAS